MRIQQILEAIGDDDLLWLADAPLDEARDYLCELPGVGRKTAACVLLFSFGRPDVPVDTHVYRVGTRLGLFGPKAPLDEAHDEMLRLVDAGERGVRAARAADPPRPPHLRGAHARLRRVPAAAHVPRGPPPARARHDGTAAASAPRCCSRVPFLIGIAALKGLTVEIDTFHGTDAGIYHLPTILQFARAPRLRAYPAAQTPLYHVLFAGYGKVVGFELWKLRLLNVG